MGDPPAGYESLRDEVRSALRTETGLLADLLASATDPSAPVPGLGWTVGELGAHVVGVARRGHVDLRRSARPAETAALNDLALADVPERDPEQLAEQLLTDSATSLTVLDRIPADVVVDFHGGTRAPVMALWAYVVAEMMVHRHDLGRALDRPQVLDPDHLMLMGYPARHVLHAWATAEAMAAEPRTWAFGFPAGQVLTVVVGGGGATIDFPDGEASSAVVDPVDFMLAFPFRRVPPPDDEIRALVAAFEPI